MMSYKAFDYSGLQTVKKLDKHTLNAYNGARLINRTQQFGQILEEEQQQ